MHRISLIIPCYRDSATLGRAIESVYAQTRPVDEIIVINDCSPETDEIERVLQAYRGIVYVKNPINLGLAATRNKGVSVASGDIVSFLDADDELHPQKIELQFPFVKENCVVACNVEQVADEKALTLWRSYKKVKAKPFRGGSRLIYRNVLTGASLMAYKRLLEQVGGYDGELRSCEDFDLWLRLIKEGVQILNIELPLYRYHFNRSGLSKNYFNISNWEMQAILKHFGREGVALGESIWAAKIWAFFILKQMVRYEASKDERLANLIGMNLARLINFPFLTNMLRFLWALGLPKVYARLFRNSRAI